MKIREGYVVRKIAGVNVVISLETRADAANSLIQLNDTGLLLWEQLLVGADEDALVRLLLDAYDVTEDVARRDVDAFIKLLESTDVFED